MLASAHTWMRSASLRDGKTPSREIASTVDHCYSGGGMGENELGETVQARDVDVHHGSITCYQNTKDSRIPLQVIIGAR